MEQKFFDLLQGAGAIQRGHFILDDGRHTDTEFRLVKAMQFPPFCRKIAYEIVKHYLDMDVQLVVACSPDAILFAAEIARQLEARVIFTVQNKNDEKIELYRNFEIHSGDRVVLVDDILTDSPQNMRTLGRKILSADARLIGVGSVVDISTKPNTFNVRQINAIKLQPKFWVADECSFCKQ